MILLVLDSLSLEKVRNAVVLHRGHGQISRPIRLYQNESGWRAVNDDSSVYTLQASIYRSHTRTTGLWAPTTQVTDYWISVGGYTGLTPSDVPPILRALEAHLSADPDTAGSPFVTTVRFFSAIPGLVPGSAGLRSSTARVLWTGYLHDVLPTCLLAFILVVSTCRLRDIRHQHKVWLRQYHGRCPQCEYDLTGVPSRVCPECGVEKFVP